MVQKAVKFSFFLYQNEIGSPLQSEIYETWVKCVPPNILACTNISKHNFKTKLIKMNFNIQYAQQETRNNQLFRNMGGINSSIM